MFFLVYRPGERSLHTQMYLSGSPGDRKIDMCMGEAEELFDSTHMQARGEETLSLIVL